MKVLYLLCVATLLLMQIPYIRLYLHNPLFSLLY